MPGPKRKKKPEEELIEPKKHHPPAKTSARKENELILLAYEEAERRLKDQTATSQIILHLLQEGSSTRKLAREKLEHENELLQAKKEALESAKKVEELYLNALEAMRSYSGNDVEDDTLFDGDDHD